MFINNKKAEEKLKQQKERREKEEDEEKKRLEAEEKELAEDPYNENVSICSLLLEYCKKLQPKQAKQEEQVKEKVDVQAVITGNQWKKDNVTLVISKKDMDLDQAVGAGKKAKKQSRPSVLTISFLT